MNVLEVDDLRVKVEDQVLLNGITLTLTMGENYILFGPNGSGKTTLLNAIMGIPPVEIMSGKILFRGEDVTTRSIDERSRLGISLGFQHPPEIVGVKLSEVLKLCLGKDAQSDFSEAEQGLIDAFQLTAFLERDLNVGFSGGERKRAEILQMLFLKPQLLLLDEPDSGVDVESLKLIACEIQRYVEDTGSTALVVTHQGDILEYIHSERACILLGGQTHCFRDPKGIYAKIKRSGYEECVLCGERVVEDW
jgi:Fe-S cluster assembly ATP-binding protein